MAELKLRTQAELHVAEVCLKLSVIQNRIHFHLPLSGEAKQNPRSRHLDFPGLCFGAVGSVQTAGLFIAARQTD